MRRMLNQELAQLRQDNGGEVVSHFVALQRHGRPVHTENVSAKRHFLREGAAVLNLVVRLEAVPADMTEHNVTVLIEEFIRESCTRR